MSRLGPIDALEARALLRLQDLGDHPAVTRSAHLLSSAGEHAWSWLVIAGVGASLDRSRRSRWMEVGVATAFAHGAAVALKRIVRRRRPHAAGLRILDATPSDLSVPSAHAASTTAAAVSAAPLLGAGVTAPVAVAMFGARLVLGVHYPSDVTSGALLGVASAAAVRRVADALGR
jgi:membrane-associated phospholipid phosphatase